jgi:hypothetical protein
MLPSSRKRFSVISTATICATRSGYNLALADYFGVSRMTEAEWARLAELRSRKPKSETPQAPVAPSSSPVAQRARFDGE